MLPYLQQKPTKKSLIDKNKKIVFTDSNNAEKAYTNIKPITMNKFEEAIAKGVTNFLRKSKYSNNDIEELHKRRYAVCKVK
jgi:hypothetical protein